MKALTSLSRSLHPKVLQFVKNLTKYTNGNQYMIKITLQFVSLQQQKQKIILRISSYQIWSWKYPRLSYFNIKVKVNQNRQSLKSYQISIKLLFLQKMEMYSLSIITLKNLRKLLRGLSSRRLWKLLVVQPIFLHWRKIIGHHF